MGKAQGEYRGGAPRRGGGDWDANADDFAIFVEPQPGEQCVEGDCTNFAPVGLTICTPCHRRRIKESARRKSLEQRTASARRRGVPLEQVQ